MRRAFVDAPPYFRCSAAVRLKDGTYAQCGRWMNEGTRQRTGTIAGMCTQHFEMAIADRPVRKFLAGYPLISGKEE